MERNSQRGMSLIELAVVMVIMGIVGFLFYNIIFSWVGKEKVGEADRLVATADKVVMGYMLGAGKGSLPDPETNASPVDGEDGSLLPVALGVGTDPWGNRLRYFKAEIDLKTATKTDVYVRVYDNAASFATDHPAAPGASPASSPTGKANASQLISNVAYVVVSLGQDGRKQYRQVKGSTYIDVLKPGLTSSNAGGSGSNESFDDRLSYKTLDELKTRYDANTYGAATSSSSGSSSSSVPSGSLATTENIASTSGTLMGSATVSTDTSVPDQGVLSLSGTNSYVDLAGTAADTSYTDYTILGWFRTNSTSPGKKAEVITVRQGTVDKTIYTWWIGLWPTKSNGTGSAPVSDVWGTSVTDDGSKVAGELVFLGSSDTLKSDFIVDAGSGSRHDNIWHFFAVVMKNTGSPTTPYHVTLYTDTISGATRTLTSVATTNAWDIGDAPSNPTSTSIRIGSGVTGNTFDGNFNGYLDDISIYNSALSDSSITSYFDSVKAKYSTTAY